MAPRRPVALKPKRPGGSASEPTEPPGISLALIRDGGSGLWFALILYRSAADARGLRAENILLTSPKGMATEEEAKQIGLAMLDTTAKQIREAGVG